LTQLGKSAILQPMKQSTLLILAGCLALIAAINAFAFSSSGGDFQCHSQDHSELQYLIKITDKQMSIASNAPSVKPTMWNLKDPGSSAYFAEETDGPRVGTTTTINQVRLDFQGTAKKVENLSASENFTVAMAYSDYNLNIDYSNALETDHLLCHKL
jgi:hypothetical protein